MQHSFSKRVTQMGKLTLIIADSSTDFCEELVKVFQDDYEVYSFQDGRDVRDSALQLAPDVMVLDLMLPGVDGLTLLEELRKHDLQPMVLATTKLYNDYIYEAAEQLGVGYLMRKPCEPAAVAERTRDLSKRLLPKKPTFTDPDVFVMHLLENLGISSRHRGYDYLRCSIQYMSRYPECALTKELYPFVANHFNCNDHQIERSIRSAVSAAWEQHTDEWAVYFPPDSSGIHLRPSNGQLIDRLAKELLLNVVNL